MKKMIWCLLCIGLMACSQTAVEPGPGTIPTPTPSPVPVSVEDADTLALFWWQAPKVTNPHLTNATSDNDVARLIYEPLASVDAAGQLVPVLAVEIPSVANGTLDENLEWVIWKVREGVKWSDGRSFTAHDVNFTYDFIRNREETGATTFGNYANIDFIEVIDLYTLKIHFTGVNPAWWLPFVGPDGMILPGHLFGPYNNENAGDAPTNSTPVGTGPYRLESNNTDEVLFLGNQLVPTVKLIFSANPYYRNADQLFFHRIEMKGGGTAEEAGRSVLQFGDVDFAYNLQLDADTVTELLSYEQGRLEASTGGRVERIALNFVDPGADDQETPHPILSDAGDPSNVLVRQALAYAIDREAIAALYGSIGVSETNVLVAPPRLRSQQQFYTYDLERAAALLAEAGWADTDGDGVLDKNGRSLTLVFRTDSNALRQDTQSIIQASLAEIGIDVKIEVSGNFFSNDAALLDSAYAGTADLLMFTYGNFTPEPGVYMREWSCSRVPAITEQGIWRGLNLSRWCSDEFDALYNQSQVETDLEVRTDLFVAMNDMIIENVIAIPLIGRKRVSGAANDLDGVALTPWDSHLWNVHEWRRTP